MVAGNGSSAWHQASVGAPIIGNKRKWHAPTASVWRATVAGVHELGLWIDVPLATEHHVVDEEPWTQPWHAVELVPFDPRARWHCWMFNHDPAGPYLYVDICDAVAWTSSGFAFVDLYMDVLIGMDGSVKMLDEDELDDAVHSGVLDEVTAARVRQDAVQVAEMFVADNAAVAREGLARWEALAARR